jgi:hypothetical protein
MTVEDKFKAFHAANPHVYTLFARFAYELIKAGHEKLSSKLIIERIRWEAMTSTRHTPGSGWHVARGKPFLIDNRYTPWYARKLCEDFPKLEKRFEFRAIRKP